MGIGRIKALCRRPRPRADPARAAAGPCPPPRQAPLQERGPMLAARPGIEARALIGLDDLEPLALKAVVRAIAQVELIEDAEFHAYRAVLRLCPGIAPAASISRIDLSVNSELGALPPITNISVEYLLFGPRVTFMKRRIAPAGNEITSSGFRSTCSSSPFLFSQSARQVPVIAMKVSLVSWLCSIGPLPGRARQ